jgi:rhamnose transport system permease protein
VLLSARELPLAVVLAALVAGVTLRQPAFLEIDNVATLLVAVSLVVVLAMGQAVVVITRGIDISVGSAMGMAGMTAAILCQEHRITGLLGALVVVLVVGVLGGILNGVLVAAANVPPIIATLGTFGLYRAVAFVVSNGRTVSDVYLPDGVRRLSLSGPLGERRIPWIIVIALGLAILTFLMLRYTRVGRHVYAVGGNADAARLRGVPVRRVTFFAYVFSGACAGLAGLLSVAHYGSVNPEQIGNGRELVSIAAVAVGGVSIFGGSGSVTGVVVAALLLGTIEQALSVLGIEKGWQATAYGAAILIAMSFDAWAGRLRKD